MQFFRKFTRRGPEETEGDPQSQEPEYGGRRAPFNPLGQSQEEERPPRFADGETVLGSWVVRGDLVKKEGRPAVDPRIGAGGFGEVYAVECRTTGARFALKVAHPSKFGTEDVLRELRAWMNLPPHPHILPCSFFRTCGDETYIFMQLETGGSLQEWVGKLRAGVARSTLAEMLAVSAGMAEGLHVAHARGLAHLDFKPANVILTERGIPRVTDFGAASFLRKDALGAGRIYRSRMYMAPEQAPEYAGNQPDHLTDIWCWGVTVLMLFHGGRSWERGPEAPKALERLLGGSDWVCRPPAALVDILHGCLRTEPNRRWPSFVEILARLGEAYRVECGSPAPSLAKGWDSGFIVKEYCRATASGGVWDDPRALLATAFERAGRPRSAAAAAARHEAPDSSPQARAVADLMVLSEATSLWEGLLAAGDLDAGIALERIDATKSLVHRHLGDDPGALGMALRTVERVRGREPGPKRDSILALALADLGTAYSALGCHQEARECCREAATLQEHLARGGLDIADDRVAVCVNESAALHALGDHEGCIEACDRALGVLGDLPEARRRSTKAAEAKVRTNMATALAAQGIFHRALEMAAVAERLWGQLCASGQAPLLQLADALLNSASMMMTMGEVAAALPKYKEAIRVCEEAGRQGDEAAGERLAIALRQGAGCLGEAGHLDEAHAMSFAAIKQIELLVGKGCRSLVGELAEAYTGQAMVELGRGRPEEALGQLDLATAIRRRQVEDEGRTDLADDFARSCLNLGSLLKELGRVGESVPWLEKSLRIREQLVEECGRKDLATELALSCIGVAVARRAENRLEDAVKSYERAMAVLTALVQQGRSDLRGDLARPRAYRAELLILLGRHAEGCAEARAAVAVLAEEVDRTGRNDLRDALDYCRASEAMNSCPGRSNPGGMRGDR